LNKCRLLKCIYRTEKTAPHIYNIIHKAKIGKGNFWGLGVGSWGLGIGNLKFEGNKNLVVK
jgi:hypothetical protein